jgi:hypothetical protein
MKDKIEKLRKAAEAVKLERQAINQAIKEQESWKAKYNKSEAVNETADVERKIQALKANAGAKNQANYEALSLLAREITDVAKANASKPIDLNDAKLTNALQLLSLGKFDYTQATGLASQFIGNQPALDLLRRTMQEKGISSGIDNMVYDAGAYDEALKEHIYNIVWQDGTPGGLINLLGKVAKFEGIEFEGLDPSYITDAARKSAGLPATE